MQRLSQHVGTWFLVPGSGPDPWHHLGKSAACLQRLISRWKGTITSQAVDAHLSNENVAAGRAAWGCIK